MARRLLLTGQAAGKTSISGRRTALAPGLPIAALLIVCSFSPARGAGGDCQPCSRKLTECERHCGGQFGDSPPPSCTTTCSQMFEMCVVGFCQGQAG